MEHVAFSFIYTRICVCVCMHGCSLKEKKLIQLLTDLSASVFRVAAMCVAVYGETWGNDHAADHKQVVGDVGQT